MKTHKPLKQNKNAGRRGDLMVPQPYAGVYVISILDRHKTIHFISIQIADRTLMIH